VSATNEPVPSDPQAGDRTAIRHGLFVLAAALAVYANSLTAGFTYDDVWIVVENERVHGLGRLDEIVTSPYWTTRENAGLFRPVTLATFAIQHALHGLWPVGYHLVNVLLHAAVSWLVWRLAQRLHASDGAALAAGLLFAVHPVHAEAVSGVVGRAELLAAGAVLGAVLSVARRAIGPAGAAGAALLAAVGLFSKEGAIVLLPLAGLVVLGRGRPFPRGLPRAAVAVAAVTAAALAARLAVVGALGVPSGSISPVNNPAAAAGVPERWLTALAVLSLEARLLLWPATLSFDYSFDQVPVARSLLDPRVLAGLVVLGALAAGAVLARRRAPLVTWGTAWFLVALLPVSNLLAPIGTLFGERLLYLPSVGFVLLAAGLGARLLASRPRLAAAALGLVVVALGARTVVRNEDWQTNESLFRAGVAAAPDSARTHLELGKLLFNRALEEPSPSEKSRLEDESFREFSRGTRIAHGFDAVAHYGLATLLEKRGDKEAALRHFRTSRETAPEAGLAWLGELRLLRLRGSADRFASVLDELFATFDVTDPGLPREFWESVASTARSAGDEERSRAALRRAAHADPAATLTLENGPS